MATEGRRVVHIPAELAIEVQRLADDAGMPFGLVIAKLLRRGLKDAPAWLRVAAVEEQAERRTADVA